MPTLKARTRELCSCRPFLFGVAEPTISVVRFIGPHSLKFLGLSASSLAENSTIVVNAFDAILRTMYILRGGEIDWKRAIMQDGLYLESCCVFQIASLRYKKILSGYHQAQGPSIKHGSCATTPERIQPSKFLTFLSYLAFAAITQKLPWLLSSPA